MALQAAGAIVLGFFFFRNLTTTTLIWLRGVCHYRTTIPAPSLAFHAFLQLPISFGCGSRRVELVHIWSELTVLYWTWEFNELAALATDAAMNIGSDK
jgi:hypothetical protein